MAHRQRHYPAFPARRCLLLTAGAGAAVAVTLAACGPTGGSVSGTYLGSNPRAARPATPSQSAGMPTAGTPAKLAITQDWLSAVSPGDPLALREMMIENGQRFAAALRSQPRQAAATVTAVRLGSAGQAAVTYQVRPGGRPAQRTGTAVYQGGTWKVSQASFCGLLGLENAGQPAACRHG